MSAPELSVVVPAYNNARTLDETLRSILDQRGVEFELIVADHASTDDTRAVMTRFAHDPRVSLIDTPAGGGAAANWNRVTAAARGEYLKLVCGDDILRPGILERQLRLLRESDAELTACRRDVVDAEGRVIMGGWGLRGLAKRMPGSLAVRRAVRAGSNLFGEPASVMMRRATLAEIGGWISDHPYLIDQATYSRVLLSGEFVPDPDVGATFRMSSAQWSVALTRDQAAQARGFHRRLHEDAPDVVRRRDLAIGNVRATIMARARQLSYRVLERRMR